MARVLLLFGGRSAEHEVSCVSAAAVRDALASAGHQVTVVGIDRAGRWWFPPQGAPELTASGEPVAVRVPDGTVDIGGTTVGFDVVFPVLHGPYGEDGTVQGLFEMCGIPYVGCRVTASALAMDKDLAKQILVAAGIPVTRWRVVRRPDLDDPSRVAADIIDDLGLPVFVKPAALGSSVGITRCESDLEIKDGLLSALAYGDKAVVEEQIDGREIEVAVLDGPRASVPGEIVLRSGWYDYDAKYHDETSRFVAPAPMSKEQTAEVRALAQRSFTALECRGLARVDFFLEEGGRGFILNEVNTMPGFTPISGFPKMWMASGMTYPELCDELVQLALT
ncbi:MAG: D-alanine--D-alanine ligase [Acidimicrobiia bacterium]|nr:D-alanine--D-alanine ligase [Acidimicrobiia bacterium]